MFTQKQFFKIIAFLGLFFIPLRTLLAIAPHKTGAQVEGDIPMDWLAFILNFVFWGFIIGGFFFAGVSLIGLRKEQKILNDLDNE